MVYRCLIVIVVLFVVFNVGAFFAAAGLGVLSSPWFAIVLGFLVPFFVALLAYGSMLPSRTATGSALALRTESFRRFLASSEGKHVDWAWEHGVLREYSAWAVALGAADAWSNGRSGRATSPTRSVAMSGPMLMYTLGRPSPAPTPRRRRRAARAAASAVVAAAVAVAAGQLRLLVNELPDHSLSRLAAGHQRSVGRSRLIAAWMSLRRAVITFADSWTRPTFGGSCMRNWTLVSIAAASSERN